MNIFYRSPSPFYLYVCMMWSTYFRYEHLKRLGVDFYKVRFWFGLFNFLFVSGSIRSQKLRFEIITTDYQCWEKITKQLLGYNNR